MMRTQAEVQRLGEDAAAALLQREGWTILHRNWSLRLGELDIVAARGGCLAFVEVKCRQAPAYVDPALAVDWRKQRKLRLVAEAYLAAERPAYTQCRFDVVAVVVAPEAGGEITITRLESAF